MPPALLLGFLAAAATLWLHRAPSSASRPAPLLLAALALAAVSAAALAFQTEALHEWNSVRTVLPVAFAHGVPLYHPPGTGPLWCNIYPPLALLLQTPAALGRTPSEAITLAQSINLLLLLASFTTSALLLRPTTSPAPPIAPRSATVLTPLLLFLALAAGLPILRDVTFLVHVDAPALAFSLLATACAARASQPTPLLQQAPQQQQPPLQQLSPHPSGSGPLSLRERWFRYSETGEGGTRATLPLRRTATRYAALAGLAAACALFCKQTTLLLPLVLGLYLALSQGRRPALRFLLAFAAAAAGLTALTCLLFSPSAVYYNTLTLPSLHGLDPQWPAALRAAAPTLALQILPLLLLSCLLLNSLSRPFLLAALAVTPTALAAYLKPGGDQNNLAFPAFFLAAAIALTLPHLRGRLATPLIALITLLALASLPGLNTTLTRSPVNPHDQAAAVLRAHPGHYYFPWHPLSHYYAERRLTHQSWGLSDRLLAHEPIPPDYLARYLPPNPLYLAQQHPPAPLDGAYHLLQPDFPRPLPTPPPDLPGWCVYPRATP